LLKSILTFSGLKECDGEAVDGAAAPAIVLTTLAEVRALSNDVVVVDLVVLGETFNK